MQHSHDLGRPVLLARAALALAFCLVVSGCSDDGAAPSAEGQGAAQA